MKYNIFLFAALLLACLTGCETLDINKVNQNALVIKPSRHTNVDPSVLTKEGTLVYTLGSVFVWGGHNVEKGLSSHVCELFRGQYSQHPLLDVEECLVAIEATRYYDVEYTKPEQAIDMICIIGLDESLGFGTSISIPMNQGKYKGGNDLIKSVSINSYQLNIVDLSFGGDKTPKVNIDIVISSKAGDVINIHFAGALSSPI